MLLSFHPSGRNLGLVAGAGTVILEHKVTLEAEAAQAEQQYRRNLGYECCAVHTSPEQLTVGVEINIYLT